MDGQPVPAAPRPRRSRIRPLIGWAVSILCIGFIAWNVDLAGALHAMRAFHWPYLFVAVLALSCGYATRILRWAVMLRSTAQGVRTRDCAAPFLGSIALNNVLPLRAGDVIRGTVFPTAIGVPRTAAIGSIVMERLLDLLTIVVFLAVGASALRAITLPEWLVQGAVLLTVCGGLALMSIFLFSGVLARFLYALAARHVDATILAKGLTLSAELLNGFRHMSVPRALFNITLLSLLVWLFEAATFYVVMRGFGIDVLPVAALLVMAFVTLSTLVPSSPGYVGPFHLAAVSIMLLLGVSQEIAASFAVLSHLVLWVPTTLAGGLALLIRPDIFRTARNRASVAPPEIFK